jgi:ABC-2 type transport system permease protein
MKKILAIIRKDIRLRFAGPSEWLFFLILPVAFTLILAGGTARAGDARIRLMVVDQASTSLSAELIAALGNSEAIRPQVAPLATAESEFSQRRVSAVLVIPASFDVPQLRAGKAELELRQQPNNLNALIAYRAVTAVISRLGSAAEIAESSTAEAERIRPFETSAARQAYFDASLAAAQTLLAQSPARIAVVVGTAKDQIAYDSAASSSAGQMITWVFIPLLGISAMFAYERQKGTLRRLLTTPTRRPTYLLGTIIGQVATALVQMLLLVGFGAIVLHLNWGQSPAALAAMLLTSALAAAALGTTLGTFVKTEAQAGGLSMMLGMVMALLGGCWYPIELFPTFVQTAAKVLPTTWAMQGMLDIVMRGEGLAGVLLPAAVLVGFAVVFFVIGVWRFRYE